MTAARASARIVPPAEGETPASRASGDFPTLDDVRAAAERLRGVVRPTPL